MQLYYWVNTIGVTKDKMLKVFLEKIFFDHDLDFVSQITDGSIFIFWPDGLRIHFYKKEWEMIREMYKDYPFDDTDNFCVFLDSIWDNADD